jgi:hypothetical protein
VRGYGSMEHLRCWYEAEVLMGDLTSHRHTMRATRAEEIETRMRLLYPKALTILVRPEEDESHPYRITPRG